MNCPIRLTCVFSISLAFLIVCPHLCLGVVVQWISRNETASASARPQQVHIAFGSSPSEMTVSWVTLAPTRDPMCRYGHYSLHERAAAHMRVFVDGGPLHRKRYMYSATLDCLQPGKMHSYVCGSEKGGWSERTSFRAQRNHTHWSPNLAVYGDFGINNAQSLPYLIDALERDLIDGVLHVGDFGYDMNDNNGEVGDIFMNMIEPVASRLPYMTCVGNHEQAYNFSHYRFRFDNMPHAGGDGEGLWYSYNLGPAHIVAFSSEVYWYWKESGRHLVTEQLKWLTQDLQKANTPEERRQRPWVIVMGHKPMYCSNPVYTLPAICHTRNNTQRTGLPDFPGLGLEDLFYKHHVDLVFGAHQHSYERLMPVYNWKKCESKKGKDPYNNPTGPVHLVTGAAGNDEGQTVFGEALPFSVFRSSDFGYTLLNYNHTALSLQQISVEKKGHVIDSVTITKDRGGPRDFSCL